MQWYHKTKCMFLSHYITVAIRIRHNLRLKNEASFPRIIFENIGRLTIQYSTNRFKR
jgi:hypothetical protein